MITENDAFWRGETSFEEAQVPPPKFKKAIVEKPCFEFPPGMLASDLFMREKVPSDFVLPGFVAGTVGALIAPGSTGKSMLAMELAALVAGVNVLCDDWTPSAHGPVVILAVEDPENELFNRWADLGSGLDLKQREQCSVVRVIPMFGLGFDVMEPFYFEALVKLCTGKRLLILDTLRRIHNLDENNSGDMARVVDMLERVARLTGCAILFLHHTSKGAALSGDGDQQQASRGSSVLVDNIRFQMFMAGMSVEEANAWNIPDADRRFFVRAGMSKVNYGAKLIDLWLRRTDGGILYPGDFSDKWLPPKKKPSIKGASRAKA